MIGQIFMLLARISMNAFSAGLAQIWQQ